jgi:prepilin-type N-terminal cleavage/methylation domain-containing protein
MLPAAAPVGCPRRRHGGAWVHEGFTLVEVLVALLLLTGVLLSLATVSVFSERSAERAHETALATTLAAQKLEQLRALAMGVAPDGTTVDDVSSDVSVWPAAPAGGGGLAVSPPGALAGDTPGFVDYLDGSGAWVGAGAVAPGTAVFTRRWSIEPADPSAPDTLVIRAGIWRRAPGWVPVPASAPGWRPVVQLETAKTRRGE